MRDIHLEPFTYNMMTLDRAHISPSQQAEMQAHISTCPTCLAMLRLKDELITQADRYYPAAALPISQDQMRERLGRRHGRQAFHPVPVVIWIGIILLGLVAMQWLITRVRPAPALQATGQPLPATPTPKATPTNPAQDSGTSPLQPLLQGSLYGMGSWSPSGEWLFLPVIDDPTPGGDRRPIHLHFISTSTREDCQASETILGEQTATSYAWLDDERLLFLDERGRLLVFTRCQPGYQDLTSQFDDKIIQVVIPFTSPMPATPGRMLLESSSAYWWLDPNTLQAERLTDPASLTQYADTSAWVPGGKLISIMQPIPGDENRSRLVVLDRTSGQVVRSVEMEASFEGRAPVVEWLGAELPFVWSFGAGGPFLADLSSDPPKIVHALPDLFGLELVYPNDIASMGVFPDEESGSYHIVVQLNLPDNSSVYVYHSETGNVNKLPGDHPVMMILPGDLRMPLIPMQDNPEMNTTFEVAWVDQPNRPSIQIHVNGQISNSYPGLPSRLLPRSQRMLFASPQGIALFDLSTGEPVGFWQLAGVGEDRTPSLSLSPDGHTLIAGISYQDSQNTGGAIYWVDLLP